VTLQIQLGELDYTASRDVVLSAMSIADEAPDPETSDSLTTLLYEKVGGNPTALKLAARNFSIYDEEYITDGVVTRLFDHVFASLDDRVRRVWLMFALLPEGAVTLEELAGLWPSWTTKDAVRVLLSRFLIEKTRTTKSAYRLGKAAREFIHQQLEGESGKALFMDLIEVIDRHMANDPEKVLATAEHVLLRQWFPVGQERRHRWITALAGHGVEQGRFAIWHAILDPIIQADDSATILYQIAYGVCLRHLSERDLAADRFRHAIRKAGDKGDFLQQGRALLELGVLYRLQGRYTRTQKLIAQAEQVAKRSKNRTLEELIRLERAQIAIDLSDGEEAKSLLRGLPESSRQLTLLSEANLIAGAFEQSRIQAERALILLGNDQAAIGRLHITIGRAYYREGKFERALDQFTLSVALLEAQQDHFGLARAWSNLGALLMNEIETYDMAGKLLTQAEQTEAILGDRVALSATRHNLNLLRRYRS